MKQKYLQCFDLNTDSQKLNKINNMNLNKKRTPKHKMASKLIKMMNFGSENQDEWINPFTIIGFETGFLLIYYESL